MERHNRWPVANLPLGVSIVIPGAFNIMVIAYSCYFRKVWTQSVHWYITYRYLMLQIEVPREQSIDGEQPTLKGY